MISRCVYASLFVLVSFWILQLLYFIFQIINIIVVIKLIHIADSIYHWRLISHNNQHIYIQTDMVRSYVEWVALMRCMLCTFYWLDTIAYYEYEWRVRPKFHTNNVSY
jgi:hypothetical protein